MTIFVAYVRTDNFQNSIKKFYNPTTATNWLNNAKEKREENLIDSDIVFFENEKEANAYMRLFY